MHNLEELIMKFVLGSAALILLFINTLCLAQNPEIPSLSNITIEQPPEHDFGDNNPDVFLCMGDSITSGFNVSGSDTYPAKLQSLLGRTVINEGLGGARSSYGVRMIRTYLNRYKPGYVLILFGVNDIGEEHLSTILNNLRTMVWDSKNNKSLPIIATLTPVFGSRAWKASFILSLNEEIRKMAKEEEILLADLEVAFNWDENYFPDGLHQNSAGNEIIANTFFEVIKSFEDAGSTGGGGGGCAMQPHAPLRVDLLLLILACLVIIGVRFSRKTQ